MKSSKRTHAWEMLVRPRSDRLLFGVCAGLAARLQVDVTLVRFGFILLSLAWGLGVVLYVALWVVSPSDGAKPASNLRARRNARSMRLEIARSRRRLQGAWLDAGAGGSWPRPLNRRWLGVILAAVGLIIVLASLGLLSWLTPMRAFGLAVLAFGIATLISLRKK